ncbi:MAG: hypothetical protein HQL97_10515 [Magnetococcales bacterium]|nr:hypothetical protein [Magnetococcales bacterium]MBF0262251.1 hypothetical protein [Magnetococcales bacterium]
METPQRKSLFNKARNAIDWLDEPDEDPESQFARQMWFGWRLLEEKRPRANSMVLVSDGHDLALVRVDAQGILVLERVAWIPTHWLPLPLPPEPVDTKSKQSIFQRNRVKRGL